MTVQFLDSDSDAAPAEPHDDLLLFTDKAVEMLREAAKKESGEGIGLRVGVIGGGCSGMQYSLAFEAGPKSADTVLDVGGVPVFIDDESQQYLRGMTIDYVTGLHGAGFKFRNPNASRTCGCGTSFST
jgi:iron-sulfur cluster assembly accessory protein